MIKDISSQKSRNLEASIGKLDFGKILLGIQDGITVTTPDGQIVYANDYAARISGFPTVSEMIDSNPIKISRKFIIMNEQGDKIDASQLPNRRALQGIDVPETVLRFKTKNSDTRWVRIKSTPIFDDENNLEYVVTVFHDFTEQKYVRLQLEESERQFRFLADSIPQIVWTAAPNGDTDYFNIKWYEYTGFTSEQATHKEIWSDIIFPEDYDESVRKWRETVKTGEIFEFRYRLKSKVGEYRWFLSRALPFKNDKGKIIKWFGTCTDINEQKRIEEQQQFLSEATRLLASSLDYPTTLTNISNMAVPAVADWVSIDLVNEKGVIENLVVSHIDPKKVKYAKEVIAKFSNQRDPNSGVLKVIKTGKPEIYEYIPYEILKKSITNPKFLKVFEELNMTSLSVMIMPLIAREKILGAISFLASESGRRYTQKDVEFVQHLARRSAIAVDNSRLYREAQKEIEERKKIETSLRESEQKFKDLSDNAPVLIWMSDKNKGANYFNKYWLEFTGKTFEEEIGIGWTDGIHPDDKEKTISAYTKYVAQRKNFKIEYRLKRNDGEYRWILDTGTPRFSENGDFEGYIGSCIDITERKNASNKMKSSLKEKEVLLKEIHHRVKNNLQVISSLLSLQSLSIKDPHLLEIFKDCQSRIRSMALVHKNLYQSNDLAHVDFKEYMNALTTSLVHSFIIDDEKVKLEMNINIKSINIDQAIPLGLIINELLSNSFKYAFPDNRDGKVEVSINTQSKNYVVVVKDNGIGLSKDIDFENTESMGLQLVNILTHQLNGEIKLDRTKGTTFTITFPEEKEK